MNALPHPARYRQPVVRDLAQLLLGQAPWHTGCELPHARLLGAHGLTLLAELDAQPQPLLDALAQRPATRRLGRYVEALLHSWCQLAPHCQDIHANLALRDGGHTLGEFDLLLRLDGEPWHLELACKYYLVVGRHGEHCVGPNPHDAWQRKLAKLHQQLRLSRHPLAARALPAGWQDCQVGSVLRGQFFYRDAPLALPPLNPTAPAGWWRPLAEPWPGETDPATRYLHLPRLAWLGPAQRPAHASDLLTATTLHPLLAQCDSPQQLAQLQQTTEGNWEECARGFVAPGAWLESDMLTLAEV